MISAATVLLLSSAVGVVHAATCSASISSLSDVAAAVACTSITLNGFTVPAGQGLTLKLKSGTTVTMAGDITFANQSWSGPLFSLSGTGIIFNGNGFKFDGGGPFYWDGQGINGGTQKPDPMMNIGGSGTIENVKVVNSPGRVFAISNNAAMTLTGITVDNSQGDAPNSQSGGKPAGANTDGFDVAGSNISILNSTVHNQDDCLAINRGSNILFSGNSCTGGHGISVGSISSNVTVSGVVITGNTIINNVQALRIKTKAVATGSTVSNITFAGNTATGITQFGVIIDQSYPSTLGTPGTGVILSGVNFGSPVTSISVGSSAKKVAVNCGSTTSCTGTWDWTNLMVSGGVAGPITNFAGITGFTQ